MRRLISVYLDGELDRERADRLAAHLETCEECRGELAAQSELSSIMGTALQMEATPDILADVLSALEQRKERRSRGLLPVFTRSLRPALAYAAAGAFGVAVGVLIWSTASPTATAVSDPLPVDYLSERPPYSLVTFYFGDTSEDSNE